MAQGPRRIAVRSLLVCLLFSVAMLGTACRGSVDRNGFVGKWTSSRSTTPIHLYENGEWEIVTTEGTVLQYGVWEYRDGAIRWGFASSQSRLAVRETTPVLSATPTGFQIREQDGSTTTFTRLDQPTTVRTAQ